MRDSWLTDITRPSGGYNLVTLSTNFALNKNFVWLQQETVAIRWRDLALRPHQNLTSNFSTAVTFFSFLTEIAVPSTNVQSLWNLSATTGEEVENSVQSRFLTSSKFDFFHCVSFKLLFYRNSCSPTTVKSSKNLSATAREEEAWLRDFFSCYILQNLFKWFLKENSKNVSIHLHFHPIFLESSY